MAAMTSGRITVSAPQFTSRPGGLFDAAEVVELSGGEINQLMGVQYESDACFPTKFVTLDPESCLVTEEKDFDGLGWEEGTPFHIYAGVECNLFRSNNYAEKAEGRLRYGEQRAAEQYLWETLLPARTVDLTPTGGAVSPTRALGILEEYAGTVYGGQPIVHAGAGLSVALAAKGLAKDGQTTTVSKFVNGSGYTSRDGLMDGEFLNAPTITLGAASAGGAFEAGDYFWVLTAINADGETLGSNELTATLAADEQQVINWTAITGATGYKLYRGTATGEQDVLVAEVGEVTTVTDTGTAGTAGTVPTENTTAAPIAASATEAWMYVTGAIVLRRGPIVTRTVPDPVNNDLVALAERSYVPTVDCMVGAILVTLE